MTMNLPDLIFFQQVNKIGVFDSIMLLDLWVWLLLYLYRMTHISSADLLKAHYYGWGSSSESPFPTWLTSNGISENYSSICYFKSYSSAFGQSYYWDDYESDSYASQRLCLLNISGSFRWLVLLSFQSILTFLLTSLLKWYAAYSFQLRSSYLN